jgi:hypothetical protein
MHTGSADALAGAAAGWLLDFFLGRDLGASGRAILLIMNPLSLPC